MSEAQAAWPVIGVVVVTYRAADFVTDCLESLIASGYPALRIVVVDNQSPDDSVAVVRDWATATAPKLRSDWPFGEQHRAARPIHFAELPPEPVAGRALPQVTLIESGDNLGFAGGVNVGLRALIADPEVELFWVLNPDTVVEPQTPAAFARKAQAMGRFGLIGGRIVFFDRPGMIQIDAGRLHRLGGSVVGVNVCAPASTTPMPDETTIAFISGASMVASRAFIERAGLMDEGYFLYFEEIDWQLRRGDLPLGLEPEARVLHHAGASIGSAGVSLKPSPFALYWTSRNLMRFVGRWFWWKLPIAYAVAYVRLARHSDGTWLQAEAMLRGLHQLPPPRAVRDKLPERVWKKLLG